MAFVQNVSDARGMCHVQGNLCDAGDLAVLHGWLEFGWRMRGGKDFQIKEIA